MNEIITFSAKQAQQSLVKAIPEHNEYDCKYKAYEKPGLCGPVEDVSILFTDCTSNQRTDTNHDSGCEGYDEEYDREYNANSPYIGRVG